MLTNRESTIIDYIGGVQCGFTEDIRRTCLRWIYETTTTVFELSPETCFLSCHLFDAYLCHVKVAVDDIKSIASAAICIASKVLEMRFVDVCEITHVTDGADENDVRAYEEHMFLTLRRFILSPTAFHCIQSYVENEIELRCATSVLFAYYLNYQHIVDLNDETIARNVMDETKKHIEVFDKHSSFSEWMAAFLSQQQQITHVKL